ncbi:MAG: DUF4197 domain-containing protein [Opitutales bacterium]
MSCQNSDLGSTVANLLRTSDGLSTAEVSSGLKQALNQGVSAGVAELSQENGFFESAFRIGTPPEAEPVFRRLRAMPGFRDLENEVLRRINQGAEDAVVKAGPIFAAAINDLEFTDALEILRGEDNAATQYLRQATYQSLFEAFQPDIRDSLDRFAAQELWEQAITRYNRLPLVTPIESELDRYVTEQALDGLFRMIAAKELEIRQDVSARTTDLLRLVFARQDG